MSYKIPRMPEAAMREMAIDWVQNKVFSDKHVVPYKREVVLAVFPALKEACSTAAGAREIADNCGLVCAHLSARVPKKCVQATDPDGRVHRFPIFQSCLIFHKDQLRGLQKMIKEERLRLKWLRGDKKMSGG